MSELTKEIEARYPTPEEVEKILIEARQMRAQVMRNAFASTSAMLQRAIARKDVRAEPRHA